MVLGCLSTIAEEAASGVDFEYAPPKWQTAICFPDDPHKTLVGHEGQLIYRLRKGPGKPNMSIQIVVADGAELVEQTLAGPRVPIVKTVRRTNTLDITEEVFSSAYPLGPAPHPVRNDVVIVTVTNRSEERQRIEPTVRIEGDVRLDKMGQRVIVQDRQTLTCTRIVTNVTLAPREMREPYKATMKIKSIRLSAGETIRFAVVFCGGEHIELQPQTIEDALARRGEAEVYWNMALLPYDRVMVPDPGIQALIDSSIRNIWQAREIKDGLPAFQVGPTVYRGLWIVDGAFLLEAATMLGLSLIHI